MIDYWGMLSTDIQNKLATAAIIVLRFLAHVPSRSSAASSEIHTDCNNNLIAYHST
jgi:hypothetical protein